MQIEAGKTISIGTTEVTLTKVSRYGMRGVMDGNKKVGDPTAITPVYRLYYKRADGTKGHQDCAIDPKQISVKCG
jgi:hypothetical protein